MSTYLYEYTAVCMGSNKFSTFVEPKESAYRELKMRLANTRC